MTISSLTARIPGPGLAAYSAARAGIDYAIKFDGDSISKASYDGNVPGHES